MIALWGAYFLTQLIARPLIDVNDPHLEEIWSLNMHTEGHEAAMTSGTRTPGPEGAEIDAENPGYETTDVNVNGGAVFLAGLFGFLVVFFVFCFAWARYQRAAGRGRTAAADKWRSQPGSRGGGESAKTWPAIRRWSRRVTAADADFPDAAAADGRRQPGYSRSARARRPAAGPLQLVDRQQGTIRIPIERAMELIAQRGLPVAPRSRRLQSR